MRPLQVRNDPKLDDQVTPMGEQLNQGVDDSRCQPGLIEVDPQADPAILPGEERHFGFQHGNDAVFIGEVTAEMKSEELSAFVIVQTSEFV